MTVSTSANSVVYRGNGATTQFSVPFKVLDEDHLIVRRRLYTTGAVQYTYVGTDYSYSGIGADSGTLTLAGPALDDDYELVIERIVPYTQDLDIVNAGGFYPETVEEQLDLITMGIQQLADLVERAAAVPIGEDGLLFSKAADRAGRFFAFDAEGKFVASEGTGSDAALRTDLAGSGGSALSGFIQPYTGAIARTTQSKLRDTISILDFQANAAGGTDCTAAFQAAIDAGNVTFPAGTYTMSYDAIGADISIPSNRKIIVEKGATITMTGGRFTVDDAGAENIEWQIDGWIKSVSMRTAAERLTWSAIPDERGFIEFGGPYVVNTPLSGFKIHGSGIVSGDWTGTPNVTDTFPFQVNRKGIAIWNAENVYVGGLNIFGFDGEAVYAFNPGNNTIFEYNYVHDTRFNALNFNAGPFDGGCFMQYNTCRNAYQIEANCGQITNNFVEGMIGDGIYTGGSGGRGPIVISRNTIIDSGRHGISADFASGTPVTGVIITDNIIQTTEQYGIYTNYVRELEVRRNGIVGANQTGSYGIGVNNMLRGRVDGNIIMAPGAATAGPIAIDGATCFDLSVDPDTNVYAPTTGTAPPYVGNGITSVASAAAVTLPALGKAFLITGTTNITSMIALGNEGREVTLIFEGILTFTDGSNLKIAGDLVSSADDTITLVCDGTNWFEVCRSVN